MIWRTRNGDLDLTRRALVMGILNVTLDSFSDGGKFLAPDAAVAHGMEIAAQGADIIDVGGESTRPGAEPIPAEEEMRRVLPVIEQLSFACHSERSGAQRNAVEESRDIAFGSETASTGISRDPSTSLRFARDDTRFLMSIDTHKHEVARAAIEAGANIINDVTGLRDPRMLAVARETGAGVIAMHMQGTPRDMQRAPHYENVIAEIREFFRHTFDRALASGIDPMCIAFDPGIGFGKTVAHNLALLKNLDALRVADRPLVLGVSRKSFLGKILGTADMEARFWPTVALTSYAREHGANVIRVHDVKPNVEALRMTEAILNAS